MELSYKLEKFEGPLDLLLHLIEKDKINIYDIPIVHITEQYFAYVSTIEEDLDIVSEFLVMAATLLDIKSKMLLPPEVDEESGEELDPREELVNRLLEYKKCKFMAGRLADMEYGTDRIFYRAPDIPEEVYKYVPPIDLDSLFADIKLHNLKNIFENIMKKKEFRVDRQRSGFGTIKKEAVSLAKKVGALLEFARKNKRFSFSSFVADMYDRAELVVSFLAVLELMKLGKISLSQRYSFDDIYIESLEEGEASDIDLSELGEPR